MEEKPITRYELDLAISPLKEDIGEIKEDVKALRSNTWLGPRGHEFLVGGSLLGVLFSIGAAIMALLH